MADRHHDKRSPADPRVLRLTASDFRLLDEHQKFAAYKAALNASAPSANQASGVLRDMYASIGECIANPDARIDLDYWHKRLEPLVLPRKAAPPARRPTLPIKQADPEATNPPLEHPDFLIAEWTKSARREGRAEDEALAVKIEEQLGTDQLPSVWTFPAQDMRRIVAALRRAAPSSIVPLKVYSAGNRTSSVLFAARPDAEHYAAACGAAAGITIGECDVIPASAHSATPASSNPLKDVASRLEFHEFREELASDPSARQERT